MARIAFLGLRDSFDFHHVGGMDSLVRRLAMGLASLRETVDLVQYGCSEATLAHVCEGVTQRTFVDLDEAFDHVRASADHVISVYLRPRDRVAYGRLRGEVKDSLRFHHIYATWNESRLKRSLLFAESRLWPFNGYLFCVSPRILRHVSRWAPRTALLLPPVPDEYFRQPNEKSDNGKLRVAYAGRLDPGKGSRDAIETLQGLASKKDCELRVYGYAWPHDAEGIGLHQRLFAEPGGIKYEPVDHSQWSADVDAKFGRRLQDTDVLLLPYRKLSSTVDMPLLLLEGMASLCVVITPPLGDLPQVYGPSEFCMRGGWSTDGAVELIERARSHLSTERERLLRQNQTLGFSTTSVAERFQRLLYDGG